MQQNLQCNLIVKISAKFFGISVDDFPVFNLSYFCQGDQSQVGKT